MAKQRFANTGLASKKFDIQVDEEGDPTSGGRVGLVPERLGRIHGDVRWYRHEHRITSRHLGK
jgi:hypothetical protein